MNTKHGFTLIELLIVIAIIGILAAIVLANLSGARAKGNDASVKTNMANISAQAEVYYDQNNNRYATTIPVSNTSSCSAVGTLFLNSTIISAVDQITKNAAGAPGCSMFPDGSEWAMDAILKGGGEWCVDSFGWAKEGKIVTTARCGSL